MLPSLVVGRELKGRAGIVARSCAGVPSSREGGREGSARENGEKILLKQDMNRIKRIVLLHI